MAERRVPILENTFPPPLLAAVDEVLNNGTFAAVQNVRFLAQSGHFAAEFPCPLSGVKRTLVGGAAMSAFDPKRTLGPLPFRTAL